MTNQLPFHMTSCAAEIVSPGSPYPGGNSLALTDSTEFKGILPYSIPQTVCLLHLLHNYLSLYNVGGWGHKGSSPPPPPPPPPQTDELPHQDFTHQLNSYSLCFLLLLGQANSPHIINHKNYAETHTPHHTTPTMC